MMEIWVAPELGMASRACNTKVAFAINTVATVLMRYLMFDVRMIWSSLLFCGNDADIHYWVLGYIESLVT